MNVMHNEVSFVYGVSKLASDHHGKLKPGVRAFWLMAAALATLIEDGSRPPERFSFERVAQRCYDEVRSRGYV